MPKLIPNAVWDAIQSEIAFLRTELATKNEHARRIERVTSGLPELPAAPPERIGPMPESLQKTLDSYEPGPAKDDLRKSFLSLAKKYGNWDDVVLHVAREMALEG